MRSLGKVIFNFLAPRYNTTSTTMQVREVAWIFKLDGWAWGFRFYLFLALMRDPGAAII